MPEPKKPEEEVKPPESVETTDGGVEVSIEEAKVTPEQVEIKEEEPKIKEPPKPAQDPLRNKVYAQDRILSNVQRSIEELKSVVLQNNQGSTLSQKQQQVLDEIDTIAQTDWKRAVRMVNDQWYAEKKKEEQQQITVQSRIVEEQTKMLENLKVVASRYPELETDPTSEKTQIFQSILEQNPDWKTNPLGPLLTMHEMEDELRKKGYAIDGAPKETESQRLQRVSSTGLPASKPVSSDKVVLTREQKAFCDENGMSYADYARTLKAGGKEGVTIQ